MKKCEDFCARGPLKTQSNSGSKWVKKKKDSLRPELNKKETLLTLFLSLCIFLSLFQSTVERQSPSTNFNPDKSSTLGTHPFVR